MFSVNSLSAVAAEPTFIFNMKKNTLTLLALISAFLANAQIVIKTNYPTASITVQRPNSLYVNGTPLASDGFLYVQWEIDSLRANWPTNGAPGTPGNGTNYVATIFTNSVLSSKQYVMLNTNPLAFNIGSIGGGYASNYVGSFSNLDSYSSTQFLRLHATPPLPPNLESDVPQPSSAHCFPYIDKPNNRYPAVCYQCQQQHRLAPT